LFYSAVTSRYEDSEEETGIFLSLAECTVLYPKLKENEANLSKDERKVLLKIEKLLYEHLSVGEMHDLLDAEKRES
jgi:hypothetical protein